MSNMNTNLLSLEELTILYKRCEEVIKQPRLSVNIRRMYLELDITVFNLMMLTKTLTDTEEPDNGNTKTS